jgi:hypothetical protein
MIIKYTVTILVVALAGCATEFSEQGARVRVVTEKQRESCTFIKMVSGTRTVGADKPGNALKEAMNAAANAGGDSLYIITNTVHPFDGASVMGEALACRKSPAPRASFYGNET